MSRFEFCPQCAAPLSDGVAEGAARRVCSARCGFVHYDNPTPVVAAVIEHEGKVLLARNRAWPEKWFGLITGFLERGESPEEGLVREVEEEVGLFAVEPKLIGVYPFRRMNQVIIAYHVTTAGEIKLGDELVDYKLIEPALCRTWEAGTGLALRDWLRSRGH